MCVRCVRCVCVFVCVCVARVWHVACKCKIDVGSGSYRFMMVDSETRMAHMFLATFPIQRRLFFLRSARNALMWPSASHAVLLSFAGMAGARASWRQFLECPECRFISSGCTMKVCCILNLSGLLLSDSCIGRASVRAEGANSVGG